MGAGTGRGANFILGPERGFHPHIVAPREVRIGSLMTRDGDSDKDALREIERCDHERAEFVRKVWGRSIDGPPGYDLVIDHTSISMEAATSLVAAAAQEKFQRLRQRAPAHH